MTKSSLIIGRHREESEGKPQGQRAHFVIRTINKGPKTPIYRKFLQVNERQQSLANGVGLEQVLYITEAKDQ